MGEYSLDQYTVSLLHFNNGITDETGKVWTAYGGAGTSTTQSKFGGSSLFLDNTISEQSKYISVSNKSEFDFGLGDYTIRKGACIKLLTKMLLFYACCPCNLILCRV